MNVQQEIWVHPGRHMDQTSRDDKYRGTPNSVDEQLEEV